MEIEDVKFHQCVRLAKFETDRTISFIPPDGEFELASYRINMDVKPLFGVEVTLENQSLTRIDFSVKVKANFKAKSLANDTKFYIPVPCDAQKPTFKTAAGQVSYFPDEDCMLWAIGSFQGEESHTMKASFHLPSMESGIFLKVCLALFGISCRAAERETYVKKPIKIEFEIPYFTVSGLNVD